MIGRTPHQFDVLNARGETPWALAALPRPPPAGWRLVEEALDGASYCSVRRVEGLFLILSGATESDGKRWLHLSVSHRQRIPTWDEFRRAKEAFLGDRYALTVLPPRREFVNIHPRVLHCFAPLDPEAWPCPEFSGVLAGVRTL